MVEVDASEVGVGVVVSQCEPEDSSLRLLWPAATGSCSLWSWPCRTEEIGWRVPSNRLWCGPTTRTCPTSGTPSGCTPGRHSFLVVSGSPSHTALVPETQSRMLSPVSSSQIPPLHSPVPPCIVGAAVWKVVEFLPFRPPALLFAVPEARHNTFVQYCCTLWIQVNIQFDTACAGGGIIAMAGTFFNNAFCYLFVVSLNSCNQVMRSNIALQTSQPALCDSKIWTFNPF